MQNSVNSLVNRGRKNCRLGDSSKELDIKILVCFSAYIVPILKALPMLYEYALKLVWTLFKKQHIILCSEMEAGV